MKNLFLFIFLASSVCLPQASFAVMSIDANTTNQISAIDFSQGVSIVTPDNRSMYVHTCTVATEGYSFERARYDIIGPIQHCAVNVMLWRGNQFFFFKKNNKTYLKHLKVLEARSYEVVKIEQNTIYLGRQVELRALDSTKNYSLLYKH